MSRCRVWWGMDLRRRSRPRRPRSLAGPRLLFLVTFSTMALQPGWAPASTMSDIKLRGLLDLVGTGAGRAFTSNLFNLGDSNFDAYRLRLFVEGPVTDGWSVYTQILFDDAVPVRAIGAYAMYTPMQDTDLHLTMGKIPWAIGTWAPRTYSNKNPLIGTPLMYQYHSTLRYDDLPKTVDALLAKAGQGQTGVTYNTTSPRRGMPVVYDLCWDMGIVAAGSARPIEYALGVTTGVPAHMNTVVDENHGKNFLGRVGFVPLPALRVGVSASYGPYVPDAAQSQLPPGAKPTDFNQELGMADFQLEFGHVVVIGEGYYNRFQTPYTGNLDVRGYYAEGKYTLLAGLYAAVRWEQMKFSDVTSSAGASQPWDQNVDRLETGLGYRLNKNAIVKGVYQRDTWYKFEVGSLEPYSNDLFAFQLSLAF